ncbi:MAG: hypothetical protein HYV07_26055 [Deltaproteobacteria bacterium]|nr:hypothetical protein [Deltaproteobacteria bacterium]
MDVQAETLDGDFLVTLLSGDGTKACILGLSSVTHNGGADLVTHDWTADLTVQPSCEALAGTDARVAISFDPFQKVDLAGRAALDTSHITDGIDLVKAFELPATNCPSCATPIPVEASPGRDVELTSMELDRAVAVIEVRADERPALTGAQLRADNDDPDLTAENFPDVVPAARAPISTTPSFSVQTALRVYGLGDEEKVEDGALELSLQIRPLPGGIGSETVPSDARDWLPLYTETDSEGRAGDQPTAEELLKQYLDRIVGPQEASKGSPVFIRKEPYDAIIKGVWHEVVEFQVQACVSADFAEAPGAEDNNCASLPLVVLQRLRSPNEVTGFVGTSTVTNANGTTGVLTVKRTTNPLSYPVAGFIGLGVNFEQYFGVSTGVSSENVLGRRLASSDHVGSAFMANQFSFGLNLDFQPFGGPWFLNMLSFTLDQFDYRNDIRNEYRRSPTDPDMKNGDSWDYRIRVFGISMNPEWSQGYPIAYGDFTGANALEADSLLDSMTTLKNALDSGGSIIPTMELSFSVPIPYISIDFEIGVVGILAVGTVGIDVSQSTIGKKGYDPAFNSSPSACDVAEKLIDPARPQTCVALVAHSTPLNLAAAQGECVSRGGSLATFRDLIDVGLRTPEAVQSAISGILTNRRTRPSWFGHSAINRRETCFPTGRTITAPTDPLMWQHVYLRDTCRDRPAGAEGNESWEPGQPSLGTQTNNSRVLGGTGTWPAYANMDSYMRWNGQLRAASESLELYGELCAGLPNSTTDSVVMTSHMRPRFALGLAAEASVGSGCNSLGVNLTVNLIDLGVLVDDELTATYFPQVERIGAKLKSSSKMDVQTLSGSFTAAARLACITLAQWSPSWAGFVLYDREIEPETTAYSKISR